MREEPLGEDSLHSLQKALSSCFWVQLFPPKRPQRAEPGGGKWSFRFYLRRQRRAAYRTEEIFYSVMSLVLFPMCLGCIKPFFLLIFLPPLDKMLRYDEQLLWNFTNSTQRFQNVLTLYIIIFARTLECRSNRSLRWRSTFAAMEQKYQVF